jgi:3-(3-hydroxy-phenyl)propionate hydroxylase
VMAREQVIVAGGGVVGSLVALLLAQQGIPVTLIDPAADPGEDDRGMIVHPASLDVLEEYGVTAFLLEHGTPCPTVQYRARARRKTIELDLADLGGDTRHPYRLFCKRASLVRFLHDELRAAPGARILLSCCPARLRQNRDLVELVVQRPQGPATLIGTYLIGAEDEISGVRALLGVTLDSFAPPERFVTCAVQFDFDAALGEVRHITYIAYKSTWSLLLRRRGSWELVFPVPKDMSDIEAASTTTIRQRLAAVARGAAAAAIVSRRVEPTSRRVARSYGHGRVFLVGDAAHELDPVDDVSLNCGINDAVDLADRLTEVWHGLSPPRILDAYEDRRRPAAMTAIKTALHHRKLLTPPPVGLRQRLAGAWRRVAGDKAPSHAALLRSSALASLQPPMKIR